MKLTIKKTHPNAIVPQYAKPGDACFDLHATNAGTVHARGGALFNTGLAFEIPEGFVMLIYSRSGHGFKNNLRLSNCVGVIDSGYRGTVAVKMHNDSPLEYEFEAGDRIAQAMIIPVPRIAEFLVADELSGSARGTSGLGSTGN